MEAGKAIFGAGSQPASPARPEPQTPPGRPVQAGGPEPQRPSRVTNRWMFFARALDLVPLKTLDAGAHIGLTGLHSRSLGSIAMMIRLSGLFLKYVFLDSGREVGLWVGSWMVRTLRM